MPVIAIKQAYQAKLENKFRAVGNVGGTAEESPSSHAMEASLGRRFFV
jgi:hypothetical protein